MRDYVRPAKSCLIRARLSLRGRYVPRCPCSLCRNHNAVLVCVPSLHLHTPAKPGKAWSSMKEGTGRIRDLLKLPAFPLSQASAFCVSADCAVPSQDGESVDGRSNFLLMYAFDTEMEPSLHRHSSLFYVARKLHEPGYRVVKCRSYSNRLFLGDQSPLLNIIHKIRVYRIAMPNPT